MSAPPENGGSGSLPSKYQFGVAVALLIGFAAIVVFMLGAADSEAATWERHIYIFSGVEAIVFTAVGWMFGREVHRQSAEAARQDAEVAKADAAEKAEEVTVLTGEATKGRALKLAVDAAAAQPAAATGGPRDVSAQTPAATSASSALASLKDLAAKLYDE